MTAAMPWRVAIGKELRALLPMWAAVMVGLALSGAYSRLFGGNPALLVFVLGAFALGALSIGHEYSAGTLATLLALPVSRTRLLAAKLAAVVTLLFPLAVVMSFLTVATSGSAGAGLLTIVVVLPLAFGLLVAPWMSILAKGPLGGVVFTAALLVGVVAGLSLSQHLFGDTDGVRLIRQPFFVVCLVGAILGWRAFTRLEAIDGARDFRVSARSKAHSNVASAARRPALLALAMKELQLQQMTFIVAALSFVSIMTFVWLEQAHYAFAGGLPYPLSMLHQIVVPILAGALASAEERGLGTLDWQALQPIAAWKQWAIKIGIAIALAVLLGAAGLRFVLWINPSADLAVFGRSAGADLWRGGELSATIAIGLALVSTYVSSFSTSGLRATITAVPVIGGLLLLGTVVFAALGSRSPVPMLGNILLPIAWHLHRGRFTIAEQARAWWLVPGVAALAAGAAAWLLLRFGLTNHRASRPDIRSLVRQAAAIGLWAVMSTVAITATSAWYWTGTPNYPSPAEQQARRDAGARHQRWQTSLEHLVAGFDGRVGVSISDGIYPFSTGVHARDPFPMQSVMKLPVAVAVLRAVDEGRFALDEPTVVRKQDLSVYVQPIAKLVGPDGFKTTIDDLMRRAIVDSDNAAADILIARLGGPAFVKAALNKRGLDGIHVDRDEKHLQSDINGLEWRPEYVDPARFDRAVAAVPDNKRDAAFSSYLHDTRDTSTPLEMTLLLQFLDERYLLWPASCEHLLDILRQTTTMPDRLKAGVPDGWTIGHKTGTSGEWRGVTAATNDVGIITGPKGEKIYISVFIAESRASATDRAALIANIARMAVDGYK